MWAFFVCLKSGRSFTFIRSCCAISCYIYLGISRYRQFAIPPPPKNKTTTTTTTTTTKQTTKSTKKRKQTKKHIDRSVCIILKVYSMGHYWVTTYFTYFTFLIRYVILSYVYISYVIISWCKKTLKKGTYVFRAINASVTYHATVVWSPYSSGQGTQSENLRKSWYTPFSLVHYMSNMNPPYAIGKMSPYFLFWLGN